MRRTVPILLATLFGLVLLFNFNTSPGSTVLTTPGESRSTSPTTNLNPSAGASPNGGGGPGTTSTLPRSAPSTTAPSTATRVIDGPAEENRYGTVQVQVTLSGNRIVAVQALQLPSDRSRSVEISDVAGPRLQQEALQAQSAQIHTISGATYTSIGYRQSLQGALDQAGHS